MYLENAWVCLIVGVLIYIYVYVHILCIYKYANNESVDSNVCFNVSWQGRHIVQCWYKGKVTLKIKLCLPIQFLEGYLCCKYVLLVDCPQTVQCLEKRFWGARGKVAASFS